MYSDAGDGRHALLFELHDVDWAHGQRHAEPKELHPVPSVCADQVAR